MTQTCIPRCPRDLGGLNLCQSAPSQVRYFPRAGTKSGYQQSRQSTWSAIQVAFGNGPGVATPPVTTASVSERARSVRPEQLSVLRSTLSKRHQPGASRSFPADKAAFLCSRDRHPQLCERCRRIKSRAEPPIPGAGIALSRKSRQRAAVKAEWARWSTCNLSWLSMTMPGAVGALGMPRNRGGQVSSGHPPESNQDLRAVPTHLHILGNFASSAFLNSTSSRIFPLRSSPSGLELSPRSPSSPLPSLGLPSLSSILLTVLLLTSYSPQGYRFPQNLPFDVKERQSEDVSQHVLQCLKTQGHCACGQLCRIFHQHVLRRQPMSLHFLYHGLFCSIFYCGLSQVLAVVCKIQFSSTPCFPSCHLHLNQCVSQVHPWTGVSSVLPAGV
ncbi:uncharacterized protein LOC118698530 isoform X3 [Molothrus ater]|uniref:uncharacterized protein LOC118698530 isoform X3 n=1 Tax=Molothrus ater TaxID=84834 RepID=UPI0023E83A6E|nr:uncharacterized protein LOC118698530 isoform X3 [Molothrus ater]